MYPAYVWKVYNPSMYPKYVSKVYTPGMYNMWVPKYEPKVCINVCTQRKYERMYLKRKTL